MTLRDDIRNNPACLTALQARDCQAISDIVSVGVVRPTSLAIGVGTILETLGLVAGNKFLDVLYSVTDYRYAKILVEKGTLLIGTPMAQSAVQAMVPGVLSQTEANKLLVLGHAPYAYTVQEIADALFNEDGSEK